MIADDRGVRPRARLTGRAGGLEGLDLWPLLAAPRWSRDTTFVLTRPPTSEIHCKASITPTQTRTLTRAPHTAFMGVFRTDYRLVLDGTVHRSARREPRPGRFLTTYSTRNLFVLATFSQNALAPSKLNN